MAARAAKRRGDDDEPIEWSRRAEDPVTYLHDVEEEAGDEAGLADAMAEDQREARELGVQLDPRGDVEPELD